MRLLIDRVEVQVPREAASARGERVVALVTDRLGAALERPAPGAPAAEAPGHLTGESAGPRSERGGGGAAHGS